jgi:carbon-monoxide dehydrogenase small subunit
VTHLVDVAYRLTAVTMPPSPDFRRQKLAANLQGGNMSQTEKRHVVTLEINGMRRTAEVEARKLLVHLIREDFGLTGTHVGCDTSQCGACTVEVDGRATKSCTVLAVMADGASITTIEGVSQAGSALDPVQSAFNEHHALQCGFCTPGMVMSVRQLLRDHPDANEEEIRHGLAGNICRCTGYHNIVRAVETLVAKG